MNENTSSAGLMWPAWFPGSDNVDDPHCTVLYLGEKSSLPLGPGALLLVANDYIDPPGDVAVIGLDIFGDNEVWVATLDPTSLSPLRAEIKEAVEQFGFMDASSFPDYKPHVTLARYEGEESRPTAPTSVYLGDLEIWWGDDRISW